MKLTKFGGAAVLLAALPLTIGSAFAQEPAGHEKDEAEHAYQAGGSPLAHEPMHQNINPKAPPMTEAEFQRGKQIFFERCAASSNCVHSPGSCAANSSWPCALRRPDTTS